MDFEKKALQFLTFAARCEYRLVKTSRFRKHFFVYLAIRRSPAYSTRAFWGSRENEESRPAEREPNQSNSEFNLQLQIQVPKCYVDD